MISGIFIARPRLAIVIAILITLAGAIALLRIPVAQFPDIVPPRVVVTATYPGASSAVVEASVAEPLEAQVVGVDKMIYMKSTSANDPMRTSSDTGISSSSQRYMMRISARVFPNGVSITGSKSTRSCRIY